VQRLLVTAQPEPEAILEPERAFEVQAVPEPDDFLEPQVVHDVDDFPVLQATSVPAELDFELMPDQSALAEMVEFEDTSSFTASLEEPPPSLTLGDLEGAEDEIMEKTLVVNPTDDGAVAQDVRATLPDPGGSYASAKDAISKLLGESAPKVEHAARPGHGGSQMDVEAALDALDSTLGGSTTAKDLGTKPVLQPPPFRIPLPEPPVAKPMNSTVKLTHEELMAAMAAATAAPVPPPPPAPPKPVVAVPVVVPTPLPPAPDTAEQSLFKVQLPKETQNNVSLDVLTTWIEQGRVQEFHMVARQQSENWLEAGKVPALRLVFERIKRAQSPAVQQAQATLVPPPTEAVPAKKGIFGGLFGRGS